MRTFSLCLLLLYGLQVIAAPGVPAGPPLPTQTTATKNSLVERNAKGLVTKTYPNPEASRSWRSSAEDATTGAAPEKVGGTSQTINMIFRLLLVLLMAYGMVLLLKKYLFVGSATRGGTMPGSVRPAPLMRVVESLPLGQGRTVHVITVGDRAYLIGVCQQNITVLGDLEGNTAVDTAVANQGSQHSAGSPFMAMLNGLLSQHGGHTASESSESSTAGLPSWGSVVTRLRDKFFNRHGQGGDQ